MRSRSNGGIIGAYQLPTQNYANGVFFIHDAAIYNTGNNPIWPLGTGFIYSATGGNNIATAPFNSNYKTHTFNANGTFSVVTGSAYIDILIVGGGGSSGYLYTTSGAIGATGGGGGGDVVLVSSLFVQANTTFTVEVGPTSATNSAGYPSKVTSTQGHNYVAKGGASGDFVSTTPSYSYTSGGSGGGGAASYYNSNYYTSSGSGAGTNGTLVGGGTIQSYRNVGGEGYATAGIGNVKGGGGGGAGTAGYPAYYPTNTSLNSYGGDGWFWNVTQCYYGAGGAGGNNSSVPSGLYSGSGGVGLRTYSTAPQSFGVGGNGRYYSGSINTNGYNGGSGTVIFCYRYQ